MWTLFPMFIVYLFDVCANGRHIAFIVIIIIGLALVQTSSATRSRAPVLICPSRDPKSPKICSIIDHRSD